MSSCVETLSITQLKNRGVFLKKQLLIVENLIRRHQTNDIEEPIVEEIEHIDTHIAMDRDPKKIKIKSSTKEQSSDTFVETKKVKVKIKLKSPKDI